MVEFVESNGQYLALFMLLGAIAYYLGLKSAHSAAAWAEKKNPSRIVLLGDLTLTATAFFFPYSALLYAGEAPESLLKLFSVIICVAAAFLVCKLLAGIVMLIGGPKMAKAERTVKF